MCLITHNIKPLVADKDLTVFKAFIRTKDGKLETPFYHLKTDYGENMVANGEIDELPSDYSINSLGRGLIHSFIILKDLSWTKKGMVFVKATIKAGTEFYVSFNGAEIASKELLISKEDENRYYDINSKEEVLKETRKAVYEVMRNETIGNEGVRVGDVLLSDKTFAKPGFLTEEQKQEAIGIVGFIRTDGTPHAIALKQKRCEWSKECENEPNYIYDVDYSEPASDFNGKENTAKLVGIFNEDLACHPALEYCAKYETKGTKAGDWHLLSSGEMLQTMRNKFIIGMTEEELGKCSCRFDFNDYWTSTLIVNKKPSIILGYIARITYLNAMEHAYARPSINIL